MVGDVVGGKEFRGVVWFLRDANVRSVLVVSGEERFQLPWAEIEKCFGIGGLLGGEGAKPERRWGRLFGVG